MFTVNCQMKQKRGDSEGVGTNRRYKKNNTSAQRKRYQPPKTLQTSYKKGST